MNEARNAIDLIIHAPEKVVESYLSSLLASKAIQTLEQRHLELREEEKRPEKEVEKTADSADKDDITLDPEFQKEFFLKTFEYKGKVVTLKKVGMGASAPVSAYVDDKRTEIFLTLQQAEREIKNIIDMKEKMKPATMESIRQATLDGILLEHEDGSQNYMTFQETQDVLEIHKRLNNTNRDKFEKTFASSEDAATQMINFFQERLRKDVI